jgi:hypothetical protein
MVRQEIFREAVSSMQDGDVVILPHHFAEHTKACKLNLMVQEENKRTKESRFHLIHMNEEYIAIVLLPRLEREIALNA